MVGAVASVLLQLPIMKHIFAWLGCCSACELVLSFYLENGPSAQAWEYESHQAVAQARTLCDA